MAEELELPEGVDENYENLGVRDALRSLRIRLTTNTSLRF